MLLFVLRFYYSWFFDTIHDFTLQITTSCDFCIKTSRLQPQTAIIVIAPVKNLAYPTRCRYN